MVREFIEIDKKTNTFETIYNELGVDDTFAKT